MYGKWDLLEPAGQNEVFHEVPVVHVVRVASYDSDALELDLKVVSRGPWGPSDREVYQDRRLWHGYASRQLDHLALELRAAGGLHVHSTA
eukprot:7523257-Pyramimonas_sp.AAC.1